MYSKEIDPSDIGKYPKLIQSAQKEMSQSDVLVCGKCHAVFHFIDLFKEHKQNECARESQLKDSRETKPKVWAFLLWKAAQLSNAGNSINKDGPINSWRLYQTWIKLEESVRETWIVAGRTIQSFAKMGQGSLQEMPVKITKTVVDQASSSPTQQLKPIVQQPQRIPLKGVTKSDDDEKINKISDNQPEQKKIMRPISTPQTQQPNKLITSTPISKVVTTATVSKKGKRTVPGAPDRFHEATVEKIVAKRFNPRRKFHEYLVKWEGFTHEQNTWEPQAHLDTCPQLLETFEKQLARQKEQRAAAERAKALQAAKAAEEKKTPLLTGTISNTGQIVIKPEIKSETNSPEKRKFDESTDPGNSTAEEDFEEALSIHSVKRLKNGTNIALKTDIKSPPLMKTVNGGAGTPKLNSSGDASADVVITKDPSSASIIRKAGVSSPNATNQKQEAQVRVLTHGENTASGIVRIGLNSASTSPTVSSVSTSSSASGAQKVNNYTSPPPPRQLPIAIQRPTPPLKTLQTQPQSQRLNVSNKQPTPPAQLRRTGASQPPVRQVQQGHQTKTNVIQRSSPAPSQPTNKLVTRKAEIASPPIQQARTIQVPHQQKQIANSNIVNKPRTTPTGPISPEKPMNSPTPNTGGITLCPITGKILSETGEEILQEPDLQDQEGTIQLTDELSIDGQQLLTNEDGTPLLVTGEDGTIYQVAGKNAEGQTILIAQGEDGQQQFAYVAAESDQQDAALTLDNVVSEAVSQQIVSAGVDQHQITVEGSATIDTSQALTIQTDNSNQSGDQDANIPAEVVQADLPSPGGTRRVILLLQDGTFMMTEMHDDEYQALNLQ